MTPTKATEKKAEPAKKDNSEGVPIIVRRTNSYLSGSSSDDRITPSTPPPTRPPLSAQKPFAVATGSPPKPPEPEPTPAAKPKPANEPESAPKPEPPKSPLPGTQPTVKTSDTPNQPEVPTVFDTGKYHLPIRPRQRGRLNVFISWVILTAVFLGVGGYVMYRLGIIDPSGLGF